MSAERLREMLASATPAADPFTPDTDEREAAHARLIALAPDAIALLADMADELRKHSSSSESHGWTGYVNQPKADALLARFAALFPEDSA